MKSAAQPPRTTGMSGVPNSPTSTSGAAGGGPAAKKLLSDELIEERREEQRRENEQDAATALRDGLWLLATMLAVIGVALALIEVFYG